MQKLFPDFLHRFFYLLSLLTLYFSQCILIFGIKILSIMKGDNFEIIKTIRNYICNMLAE